MVGFGCDYDFERSRKSFKTKRNFIIGITIILFVGMGFLFVRAKQNGKKIYTIEVFTFNTSQIYTSDSIILQTPDCIKFVNLLGQQQTVSGENITVTQF